VGLPLHGHAPIILNYTIQNTDTWEEVTGTGVNGVRKWMIKLRENSANTFDIAFEDSAPSVHMSNSGVGLSMDNCDLPTVFIRGTATDVVEILYWG